MNPGFNKEKDQTYTLTVTVCAYANCTTNDLVVTVVDRKDIPVCSPGSLDVSILETNTWVSNIFELKSFMLIFLRRKVPGQTGARTCDLRKLIPSTKYQRSNPLSQVAILKKNGSLDSGIQA
jgi:hypothetical protein